MPRPIRKAAPVGLVLDAASRTPLHRQIGEQVRRAILERRLAPGQRLPSSRLMARELDESGFAVERAIAGALQAKLAVVTPAHQFPLGTVLGLQRRLELLSWAERREGWIAEDDFDGEYRYAGRPLAPLRALDRSGRVAYLASFSKLLFPALRRSYVVLPAALVPAAEKRMAAVAARPSLLGQGALARFIAEGHLTAHLRRTRLLYAARQEALIAGLERHLARWLESPRDPGGMHLIARPVSAITPTFDDCAVTAASVHAGIAVAPLSACYAGRHRQHGLILGYAGTPESAIDPACAALARALHHAAPARRRSV